MKIIFEFILKYSHAFLVKLFIMLSWFLFFYFYLNNMNKIQIYINMLGSYNYVHTGLKLRVYKIYKIKFHSYF
jgi:hypothetical protein